MSGGGARVVVWRGISEVGWYGVDRGGGYSQFRDCDGSGENGDSYLLSLVVFG